MKIYEVSKTKIFKTEVNNKILNAYFEKTFLSVRRMFYKKTKEEVFVCKFEMIDDTVLLIEENKFDLLEKILTKKEHEFILLFIDNFENRLRKKKEVAKILNISEQAVSKRFNNIVKKIYKTLS